MADIQQFQTANGVSPNEAGLVNTFPNFVESTPSRSSKCPKVKAELINKFNEIKHKLFSINKEFTKQEFDDLDCVQVIQRQTDFAYNVLVTSQNILQLIDVANPKFTDVIKNYFKVNDKITFKQVVQKLIDVNNSLLTDQFGINSNKVSYGIMSSGFASIFGAYASTSVIDYTETNFGLDAVTDMVRDGYRFSEIIVVTLIHETIHRATDFGRFIRINPNQQDIYKEDQKDKFIALSIEKQLNNPDSYAHCYYDLFKAS